MRYYYSKLGPVIENKVVVVLGVPGQPSSWYVKGFDDPRIKLGSIYPLGATTGYLDIEPPDEPDPLPVEAESADPPLFRM